MIETDPVLIDGGFARVTRDIDLLAWNMPDNAENMKKVFL